MSDLCNGVAIHTTDISVTESNTSSRRLSVNFDKEESFALENIFRGFEKSPVVSLARTDISPYLKNIECNTVDGIDLKTLLTKLDFAVHSRRLRNKCSVSVIRDDLDKLRTEFLKNPDDLKFKTPFNMSFLKCKICEKVYSCEKKLANHQEKKHMIIYKHGKTQKRVSFSDHVIVHEVTEYHKCRKCTKIFEHYRSLKLHMKQKHKKRKCYICNYCNKNFVDRMFFKVHIKLHCDVCGDLSPNKSKFLEHRRNICKVLKLHKCKTCDVTFFKFMDLKDHSYEHLMISFICDICKDQFQSKCAVAHHIGFLHSKIRPVSLYTMRNLGSERLYLCNFCDESSVERDEIEKHVATLPDLSNRAMTGYKDYYFCDQCLKKFDTETDMLQHKWTHFLKTSDNSQLREGPEIKRIYKIEEKIPEFLKPKVVLEKMLISSKEITAVKSAVVKDAEETSEEMKAVVDPLSKKTIISKHQCQTCGKYYSSNYCLNRHIVTQHSDFENLKCKVCEETFVWPSLLVNHKCIRLNLPELPFQDARPEIHFDNLHEIHNFDDLPIEENYMNTLDFDIPAPIVELVEYETPNYTNVDQNNGNWQGLGRKIVIQEVPIEF